MLMRWQLEASTDGEIFLTLFSAPNPTHLGNEVQQFEVDTVDKYNCYRLLCLEAEPSNPGLSYMRLFIYLFRLAEYYNWTDQRYKFHKLY